MLKYIYIYVYIYIYKYVDYAEMSNTKFYKFESFSI